MEHILPWLSRHVTIIVLAVAVVMLGGTDAEQWATIKSGMLAEMVALFLSHVALFTFTPENFNFSENRYAKIGVFIGVHLLFGLVYAGSLWVKFAPGSAL